MNVNEILSIYDSLYSIFDKYIINNNKDGISNYYSIFFKKEFVEFLKYDANIKIVSNKKVIKNKDEIIDELLYAFKTMGSYINKSDLFSKNEEIEDINTKYIKLLLIPFILGSLCYETLNINIRYERLKDAILYYNEFLRLINMFKIIDIDDYLYEEEGTQTNPTNRRNIKIKRAKDEHKFELMYNDIFQKFNDQYNKRKIKDVQQNISNNTYDIYDDIDDEEIRKMYISLIKHKCMQTLNTIDLIHTELPLLKMRNDKQQEQRNKDEENKENKENSNSNNSNSNNSYSNNSYSNRNNNYYNHSSNEIKNESIKKPWFFTIKKNMKPSDITELRNYYKDLVFKPFHNLPTISLEECAQMEMQYSLKGTNDNDINNTQGFGNQNEEKELLRNEKNDDYYKEDLKKEDEKDLHDREWDDWKDLHPKGIGNKNKNIG
ncbi:type 2A phosphatase-associated protein 42, putative [Plasmodium reichenowi]|uniref:Type 2A phosphatase-associated protein 42, putative n=1 Tax=Plasmodium reichenowi TaxID=5854 RepID=A0A151LN53_PLARE|nr:type 2A phosphatase-associated protein 42, putative [Plasmodium reichenowi]KYO00547.1 type 2A phosphatase-associated protein 42, putative [Plasmodium reichenowi]